MADLPTGAYADSDDLPAIPQPRDPTTGQYRAPGPEPTPQAVQPEPKPEPAHNPYMLARARALGVPVTPGMTPDTLGLILANLEARQTPPPAPEPEEAVDWGTHDGKALTEADFDPRIARLIKDNHALKQEVKKTSKSNDEFRQQWQAEQQAKADRAAERQLDKILATRPDLFGDDPSSAKPGSPEAKRRQAVKNDLLERIRTKTHTTLDADAADAMAMFGPDAPKAPAKSGVNPALAAYQNAELARPSGRRGAEVVTRREAMIAAEQAKRNESNGSYVPVGDDNDDLPDLPRG